jgi:hypothetical protein
VNNNIICLIDGDVFKSHPLLFFSTGNPHQFQSHESADQVIQTKAKPLVNARFQHEISRIHHAFKFEIVSAAGLTGLSILALSL